jgi:hypothetical protein
MTTPTVYTSRSRANRRRLLLIAAVIALVLVGVLIGRLASGGPAQGSGPNPAPPAPSASASAPPSADPSPTPSPADTTPSGVDAYVAIQAESASALQGINKENTQDQGGGQNLGWISKGDWLKLDGINFGDTPATQFYARVASDAGDDVNGRIEIRLDSQDSAPVGTMPIKKTGGWQKWVNQVTDVSGLTGVHTVFLTFAADKGDDFVNLNWVQFGH